MPLAIAIGMLCYKNVCHTIRLSLATPLPIKVLFNEHLYYDPIIMNAAVLKAKEFYLEKLLLTVVPCILISQECCEQKCTSTISWTPVTENISPAPVMKNISPTPSWRTSHQLLLCMTCHFSCRKGHVTSFYHEAHLMKDMSPAPIMKDGS